MMSKFKLKNFLLDKQYSLEKSIKDLGIPTENFEIMAVIRSEQSLITIDEIFKAIQEGRFDV